MMFVSKLLHIAPWAVTAGLLAGAARVLAPHGRLFIYGTFTVDRKHSAQRNTDFDQRLQSNNSEWGVRDASAIAALAKAEHGLSLIAREEMPDDDLMLVFERSIAAG